MVKIIGVKQSQTQDGKTFNKMQLQGGAELEQSKETGKFYLTARTCYITTTLDEASCRNLIGSEMTGTVEKVKVEPYEFTVKETGEIITLTHSWEYSPLEPATQVVQTKKDDLVITEETGW